MDVLGLAVNQTPHELLATQHAFLAIGTGPVEIDRFCGQITFCILQPSVGRLFATSFPPLLLLVPINAEIARLFRRLGLLGLGLVVILHCQRVFSDFRVAKNSTGEGQKGVGSLCLTAWRAVADRTGNGSDGDGVVATAKVNP